MRFVNVCMQISFFERLKSVRNDLKLSLHSPMVSLKKKECVVNKVLYQSYVCL